MTGRCTRWERWLPGSGGIFKVLNGGRNIYYSGEESVMILHMQKSEYYSFNAINFRLGNVSVLVARR